MDLKPIKATIDVLHKQLNTAIDAEVKARDKSGLSRLVRAASAVVEAEDHLKFLEAREAKKVVETVKKAA